MRLVTRSVPIVTLVFVLVLSLTSCTAPDTYVALGDSYTAGPLIPDQSTDPLGCLRSDRNYPSVANASLNFGRFVDVSCSGAETEDMFAPQGVTPGPNPPQLDAVDARSAVVTLGIGGNDIGFSGIVQDCVRLLPFQDPCRDQYTADGDEISDRIAETRPKVVQVVEAIQQRAPRAKILIVGYPVILPDTGNGCWPLVPIYAADVQYLRAKEKELNAMLASVATSNDVLYVDTYTSSIGHDVCSGDKWVEGLIPTSPAAPVHPNADGMAHTGAVVRAAILLAYTP